ncbi:9644_t:CDS:2 [Cetraspora pellucida]|uniref:9644_t:CDS:1 n=1 Tax=Cetraspora pellucida TaxID=1433469 RepID=A0ACA9KEX5_9GLOM|nr:9644_t:CDS:2 [Cetraspora pellucida]
MSNTEPKPMKAYIDESIRSSTISVTGSIKQYIDSQFDRQKIWNEQLQLNINMLAQMTQTSNDINTTEPGSSTTPAEYMKSLRQSQKQAT